MTISLETTHSDSPPPPVPAGSLRVVPLGGLGEFGMNMCAFEYGEDIVIVDCGVMFPDAEMLGVDLVVPDVAYLEERAANIRAILITHGHEDHIGGLPYILPQIPAPIYATRMTLGMIREKLKEFQIESLVKLNAVEPRDRVKLGVFEVEFITVTHSIPNAVALAIRTPVGTIVHTGDYRIETSPYGSERFDAFSFSRCGEEGVVLLMADSTNVERSGSTGSEHGVRQGFERIVREAEGAVVISCFSTSIHRVQIALDVAAKTGRVVFLCGYSMEKNSEIALATGFLHDPHKLLRDVRDIETVSRRKRLIVSAGSQGEALSALSRMSLGNHRNVVIGEGDVVAFSARIIPGNERNVYRIINHFIRAGAKVYYERNSNIHVSGHAYRDEMRTMLSMTRPKNLTPVHGELYQLMAHRELAMGEGIPAERIFVLEDGYTLEIDAKGEAKRGPKVQAGPVMVDGRTIGEVGEVVLRDRKHLSQDGMITVILVIDRSNGEILAGPDIVSRGFVYMDENEELIQRCKDVVLDAYNDFDVASREEPEVVRDGVRRALRKFLRKETERFPVILPVVMEV